MARVVQKYGGSSVADLDRISVVARRIAACHQLGDEVVVVVSAMGNTTNELIALAQQVTDRPDRRELDMLISVGERISMALLAMKLRDLGVPARSLTGSQSGIITDESHADARVVEVRPARVQRLLEEGFVVIVAGFQGVSRDREVTTLGRGGSDTTAVVLAAALEATHCEICSDVDGVWSADPRVVPDAIRLDELSLEEGLALARGGAKVLFEDALRYARDHGVTLRATATHGPGAGTTLSTTPVTSGQVSVTGDRQLHAIRVGEHATAAELQATITGYGLRLRRQVGRTLHFDIRNAHAELRWPQDIEDLGRVSVVTAVASCLGEDFERLATAERSIRALGVQVMDRGGQGDSGWWQVPVDDLDRAVVAVHAVLMGTPDAD